MKVHEDIKEEKVEPSLNDAEVIRSSGTNEIVEVVKNIEAEEIDKTEESDTDEVRNEETEVTQEDKNVKEMLEQVAEEIEGEHEEELVTATSSDSDEDDTVNQSIMSANKGDAFAAFVNKHADGPLFGEQIGTASICIANILILDIL